MVKYNNNNNNNNSFKGIDIIYWINLEYAKERKYNIQLMLEEPEFKNIPNIRIDAIDGKKETNHYFSCNKKKMSNLEYACLISHLKTIHGFSKSNYKMALILEDDMTLELKKYWKKSIQQVIKNAPSDWEIIQLCYISNEIPNREYTLNYNKQYYSTGAYLIKNSAAKKLINSIYSPENLKYYLEDSISHEADHYLYNKLITYTYKNPYFIYKTDNNSYIHQEHVGPIHNKSKTMVLNHLAGQNKWFVFIKTAFGVG
jgi:GR25 family glycosyltransferase involved in LPS biosynthesis